MLIGAKKSELKKPKAKLPYPNQLKSKPTSPKQKMGNLPSEEIQSAKPLTAPQPAKSKPAAPHPTKPQRPQLVSEEARAENASIAETLKSKSSEMSGLPSLFDHMLKEDSLTGKAVIDDLVQQVKVDDPETSQKLEQTAAPVVAKFANAIRQAQTQQEEKYQRDLAAYQQYAHHRQQASKMDEDRLLGGTGTDEISDQEALDKPYPRPNAKPEEPARTPDRRSHILDSSKQYDSPTYTKYLENLLSHEGGYSDDPDDKGGATQNGVSTELLNDLKKQSQWSHLPDRTKDLTPAQVSEIYYKEYYQRLHFDKLRKVEGIENTNLAEQIFDFTVNSRSTNAGKIVQQLIEELDPSTDLTENGKHDGIIGGKTRTAIEKLIKKGLGEELNNRLVQARLNYMKDQDDWKKYKRGWTRRAKSFLM